MGRFVVQCKIEMLMHLTHCLTFSILTLLQTGPKGVIKDFQRFKQLEREQREEQKEELAKLAKKFSITCRTNVSSQCFLSKLPRLALLMNFQAEDEKAKSEEDKLEAELDSLIDEEYLQEYLKQRMQVVEHIIDQKQDLIITVITGNAEQGI